MPDQSGINARCGSTRTLCGPLHAHFPSHQSGHMYMHIKSRGSSYHLHQELAEASKMCHQSYHILSLCPRPDLSARHESERKTVLPFCQCQINRHSCYGTILSTWWQKNFNHPGYSFHLPIHPYLSYAIKARDSQNSRSQYDTCTTISITKLA